MDVTVDNQKFQKYKTEKHCYQIDQEKVVDLHPTYWYHRVSTRSEPKTASLRGCLDP